MAALAPSLRGSSPLSWRVLPSATQRITFRVLETDAGTLCRLLRERRIDLAICRPPDAIDKNDFASEYLFEETMVVIAGRPSRWSTRRKLNLRDLLGEPWALPEPDNVAATFVADVFRVARLKAPKPRVVSNSVAARLRLVETGKFLTIIPASMLHFGAERLRVKRLPINLSMKSPPLEIISLRKRTPSAVARMFLNELRDFSQTSGIGPKAVRESVRLQTRSR